MPPEVLRIVAGIATPLALLGVVAAFLFYGYIRKVKSEETQLKEIPADKRAAFADEHLTRYGLSAEGLSAAAKERLLLQEMEKRHQRYVSGLGVGAIIFVICFALAVVAFVMQPGATHENSKGTPTKDSSSMPTPTVTRRPVPDDCSGNWLKHPTVMTAEEALMPNDPIPRNDGNRARLRTIVDQAFRSSVANIRPDRLQFNQRLVLLTDRFGADCGSLSIHLAIDEGIELRGVDARIINDGGEKPALPISRTASVRLPEVRTHWGDIDLTALRGSESLLLIVLVGVEQGDLRTREAKDYKLTLTKN